MKEGLTIGRLAKEAGVNVETIRYYQRRGLIDEPPRPLNGHRRYPDAVMARIAFIRSAQQLGFSLAEVQSLLRYSDGKSWRETRTIAEKKYAALSMHVEQLNRMRHALKGLIAKSLKGGKGPCPIITALMKPR